MLYNRKSIPKSLKDLLWDTTYGPEAGQGTCYVCGIIINSKRFEAGHVISVYEGGSTTLDNLRCICSTCNKSMGTRNLERFKNLYFPIKKNTCKNNNFIHDEDKEIYYTSKLKSLDKFIFNPNK